MAWREPGGVEVLIESLLDSHEASSQVWVKPERCIHESHQSALGAMQIGQGLLSRPVGVKGEFTHDSPELVAEFLESLFRARASARHRSEPSLG